MDYISHHYGGGGEGEGDMLKATYDANVDGIVDRAAGTQVVAALPAPEAGGKIICKDSELYLDV